ncbi:putative phage tail assembly chaperone [Lelliottia aquatilis]|nr:putative phage tail assembly chaperone [Lelliottia aquatilis]
MAIEKIELTVGGTALAFAPTATDYNNMINSMQPDNKVAPAQQFLMRTVLPAHADALKEVLKKPGAVLQLMEAVISRYAPKLEIEVKE